MTWFNTALSLSNRSDCDESANDDQSIGQDHWQITRAHSGDRPHGISFSENDSKDAKAEEKEASIKILPVFRPQ